MWASQIRYDGQFTVENFKFLNSLEPETTFVNCYFSGGSKGQKRYSPFWLGNCLCFKDSFINLVMTKGGPLTTMSITLDSFEIYKWLTPIQFLLLTRALWPYDRSSYVEHCYIIIFVFYSACNLLCVAK